MAKINIGPFAPSRVFRLVQSPGAKVAHVQWIDEPCALTADDLLVSRDQRQAEASTEAIEFLNDELADGARPSREIERRARALGISGRTLSRAKKRAGIRSHKKGFGGEWFWSLPESDERATAAAIPERPLDDEELV